MVIQDHQRLGDGANGVQLGAREAEVDDVDLSARKIGVAFPVVVGALVFGLIAEFDPSRVGGAKSIARRAGGSER